MEDGTFVRDEDQEEAVQRMIYESARGPEQDGDDDEFTQFLNDVGEGLESEEIRRGNEVSITNSGEVYICIFVMLMSIYIHAYINTLSSFSPSDRANRLLQRNEARAIGWIPIKGLASTLSL